MQDKERAIGILGGTFDPIHIGHLRLAIEFAEIFNLATVHLIPCYQPVHRQTPIASPDERLMMVQYAVENESNLIANPCEINRRQCSYTIDTLLELRQEMPDTPFCLLLGIDAFLDFPTWHRFQEILKYAHLIVAHRPNYKLSASYKIGDLIKDRSGGDITGIHNIQAGKIWFQPITALDISSSNIRKKIATQQNIKYLLPDKVNQYIKQYGIYYANS